MGKHLANRSIKCPHEDRLSKDHPFYDAIVAAHALAIDQGQSGYLDPETSLFVLCATYLAHRGDCCEQGCRHCPYIE